LSESASRRRKRARLAQLRPIAERGSLVSEVREQLLPGVAAWARSGLGGLVAPSPQGAPFGTMLIPAILRGAYYQEITVLTIERETPMPQPLERLLATGRQLTETAGPKPSNYEPISLSKDAKQPARSPRWWNNSSTRSAITAARTCVRRFMPRCKTPSCPSDQR